LTQHNVLRYTTAVVKLTEAGGFKKNLNSLFERTTHQRTSVVAVDTVAGDSHKETTLAHDVDEQSHVTMVDVRTVERQDHAQLLEETSSSCFDTKHTQNLDERVGVRLSRIYTFDGEYFSQRSTVGIEHPLFALIGTL
jgi:hypothetical protein